MRSCGVREATWFLVGVAVASMGCGSIKESTLIESRTQLAFDESQEADEYEYRLEARPKQGRLVAQVNRTPLCQNVHIEERKETRIVERSSDGMLALEIGMAVASGAAAAYFLSTSSSRPPMQSGPTSNDLTSDTSNTLGVLLLIHGGGWGAAAVVDAFRARDSREELPIRRIETPGPREACGESGPASGTLVTVSIPAEVAFKRQARTDARGLVSFEIPSDVPGRVPDEKAGEATAEAGGRTVTWSVRDLPGYADARRIEVERLAREQAEQEAAARKQEATRQAAQARAVPTVPEMTPRERKVALRTLNARLGAFVAHYGEKASWRMRNRTLFGIEHSAFLEHGMTDYGRQRSHYEGLKMLDDGVTPKNLFVLARNTYKTYGKQDGALTLREALGFTIRDAELLMEVVREAERLGLSEHDLR